MTQIDIQNITPHNLKKGHFKDEIPEIYHLKKYIENNSWHRNSDVFSHTLQVLKNINEILKYKEFEKNLSEYFDKYLSRKIGNNNRKELLKLAALYHDIAKPVNHLSTSNGETHSPTHAQLGSMLAKKHLRKFALESKQIRHIQKIIEYHDFIIDIQNQIIQKRNQKKFFFRLYFQLTKDFQPELSLLYLADLKASELQQEKPEEYKIRKKLLFDFYQFQSTKR